MSCMGHTGGRSRQRDARSAFLVSVAGGIDAPRAARRSVIDRLDGDVDSTAREILTLLIGEVVTNSVVHARADTASQIDLNVSFPPGAVRVEVSTPGAPFTRPPVVRNPVAPVRGGRGLVLVDRLSRDWGGEPGDVNMVWFELETPTGVAV